MAKIISQLPSGGTLPKHNDLQGLNEDNYIHLTQLEKANLDNQSGINTGDETTSSIQTKRPLKTVDGKSLEGTGNIEIDYNTVINKPTTFPPSPHTHTVSQITDFPTIPTVDQTIIDGSTNAVSGNAVFDEINILKKPNQILQQTDFILTGQDITFNSGWIWRINTIEYTNPSQVVINFPLATTGNSRLDLVVLTTSNTFLRVAGVESVANPVAPSLPNNTLEATIVVVTDGVVNQPIPPISGGAYVQKSERANVVLTGSGVINQLDLVDEKATIVFKGSITRLNTISYASVPYNGKRITLFNAQATPVTIGHSVSGYGVDFVFANGQDYVLAPNETIEFSFDITYAPYAHHMLIGSKTDISGKVDKISTVVDARDYSSLNAAISAIGSMRATILVTNIQTTIASLTIPTNISIEILQGGSIVKNLADILVINGSFKAGIYKVFSGYNPGDITFGKASIDKVYPQWWGENTTQGITNMTLPIQSAINSILTSGGRVKIPVGSYLIDSLTIPYITNNFRAITIEGEGKWNIDGSTVYHNGTQLKSNSAVPMFAPVNNSDGITLKNMVLDGNNIGTYGWYGLFGSFTTLENCIFTKFTQIGAYTAQGLCQIKYCYSLKNAQGIKWNSDGIVEYNKIIGNTGDGLILTNGGNYVSDNEIEGNGGRGIYINGTLGNNANNIINNNYLENNLSWHIFLEGASTSNRTISKIRITGNYLSSIAVPNGNVSGGIKLLNSRASNIANNNFIGSFLGANLLEQQAILLENSDLISITNFVGEQGYRNAIKIVNSFDITLSDICLRDFAQVGTSSDDAFGIYINATCNRIYLSNIAISEYRGVGGFMKGIKSLVPISLVNYSVSTPISSPDSFFGSLFYKTSSGATNMALENNEGTESIRVNGEDGTITTSGNISPQGLSSSTGQITSSGSTTTTMFTMENANENRVYLIIARQSGSADNSVMGYVTTYGANSTALNVAQSNTNPTLFLTVASSGLNVQLTIGSGYGQTTWDWTYTRIK